jgi:hypothetical protein
MQLSNEKEGKQNKDYTQTNTNKVNKTWVLLQQLEVKTNRTSSPNSLTINKILLRSKMVNVSLDCPFLIAPSIFSSVYLHLLILSEMYYGMQLSNEKCFTYTKNAQPCANNSDVKRNRVPLV